METLPSKTSRVEVHKKNTKKKNRSRRESIPGRWRFRVTVLPTTPRWMNWGEMIQLGFCVCVCIREPPIRSPGNKKCFRGQMKCSTAFSREGLSEELFISHGEPSWASHEFCVCVCVRATPIREPPIRSPGNKKCFRGQIKCSTAFSREGLSEKLFISHGEPSWASHETFRLLDLCYRPGWALLYTAAACQATCVQ
jgi:hypothetical protein